MYMEDSSCSTLDNEAVPSLLPAVAGAVLLGDAGTLGWSMTSSYHTDL